MICYIPYYSSFCSGVQRAVDNAYMHADTSTYMYGRIVHNPTVIEELMEKGVHLVEKADEIPPGIRAKVLVRAHGISKKTYQELYRRNVEIIDNTCTKVNHLHEVVEQASHNGADIILIGDPNHPEVIGTVGWAYTKVFILKDIEEAREVIPRLASSSRSICMVAQTTYNKEKYKEIYEYCISELKEIEFYDTICSATAKRQNEITQLAKKVDGFIIIGGRMSSNTKKLFEIAADYCENVQLIEDTDEIDVEVLAEVKTLAITGGASTPQRAIEEVIEQIKEYCKNTHIDFTLRRQNYEHFL